MIKFKKNLSLCIMALLSVMVIPMTIACSDTDIDSIEEMTPQAKKRIPLHFEGNVVLFDDCEMGRNKATSSSSWNNGDKIYITFYDKDDNMVSGEATFSTTNGWSVSYDVFLQEGKILKCETRYFANATFSSSSLVSLNTNSEIYEDINATYALENGQISVIATLSPKTGRIRFSGNPNTKIHTTGVSVYTTFSPATNQFTTSGAMITSNVASNGYTPYIYGQFEDNEMSIGLVGDDCAFTRKFSEDVLAAGQSGYMTIPTESAHNNWRNGLYIKTYGVEFKMIPVAGHSDGFFLIGETEVTEALYESVNGTANSSQLPVSDISYREITSFIEKINNSTKLTFSLPSTEQWQYAAKGGAKSQGYTYSGSNTPGDVAWYSANTSSKQNVKTKAPNELGIYDMSGNVGEYSSRKDYACGGCFKSPLNYITAATVVNPVYGNSWEYSGYVQRSDGADLGIGFRLILTCE